MRTHLHAIADPTGRVIAALDDGGFDPKSTGPDAWESRCPAHNGGRRNLTITRGDDGRCLVHCQARGCPAAAIAEAIGLTMNDLRPPHDEPHNGKPRAKGKPPKAKAGGKPRKVYPTLDDALAGPALKLGTPTAHWVYQAADGTEAARVYRFDPPGERKEYRPVHRSEDGWILADPPGLWPLYQLPELVELPADRVYLAEGEKAADLARGLGVLGTTYAHGAKSVKITDWSPLAGRDVVFLPDADEEGENAVRAVASELAKLSPRPTLRIARMADLWRTEAEIVEGADLEEWLADGVPESWEPEQCRAELARVAGQVEPIDWSAPIDQVEAGGSTPALPAYRLIRASEIDMKPIEWLWPGRIPIGMLTLFAGDPGLGKSMMTSALAAMVSRGAALPFSDAAESPAAPGGVVILNAEDDPARTIVPRLHAAGADLDQVYLLDSVRLADGSEAIPSLKADLDAIEDAIASIGNARLVIIDPISAYLGAIDDHRNAELRGLLSPLKTIAERRNIAVILVTHLSKATGLNAKHRVIGSVAYVGACRAGFIFVRDRDDPTGRRVLVLPNKFNVGPEPSALAYRVEDRGSGPAVEWDAEAPTITADEALAAESLASDPDAASEARECETWLHDYLTSAGGQALATDAERDGKAAGFSLPQLKRAKRRIAATTSREGFGPGSRCYWRAAGYEPPDPI